MELKQYSFYFLYEKRLKVKNHCKIIKIRTIFKHRKDFFGLHAKGRHYGCPGRIPERNVTGIRVSPLRRESRSRPDVILQQSSRHVTGI